MYKIESIEDAKALEDCELGVSEWITINQERINQFANATGDDQWIHVDSSRAKNELPDGKTIAHGYLTLSLIPALTRNFIEVAGLSQVINFGCNKVRARGTLLQARKRGSMIQLLSKISVEVDGSKKPACVVEMLVLLVMK